MRNSSERRHIVAAELSWLQAWVGSQAAVHLANVAEYAEGLLEAGGEVDPQSRDGRWRHARLQAARRYSGLAWFHSPCPRMVLFPGTMDPCWGEWLGSSLEWDSVEVYAELASRNGTMEEAVLQRPTLLRRMEQLAAPIIPWGYTPAFQRLLAASGRVGPLQLAPETDVERLTEAGRRFECKHQANRLFHEVAPGHAGIRVPKQVLFASPNLAIAKALWSASRGHRVMCKTLQGAGGSGVALLSRSRIRAAGGVARAAAQLRRAMLRTGSRTGLVLEEYVGSSGVHRDLTVDAVIDSGGTVQVVGTGYMQVRGTAYQGVSVGPDLVAERWNKVACNFATAVGAQLAATGYSGWFDIDFVIDDLGQLCPTEINCRLTGPAAAFMLAARLLQIRGRKHFVRVLDAVPLAAPMRNAPLFELLQRLRALSARLGVELLPTLLGNSQDEYPTVGLALAAETREAVEVGTVFVKALLRDREQIEPYL